MFLPRLSWKLSKDSLYLHDCLNAGKGSFFNKGSGQENTEGRGGPVKYRLNSVVGISLDTRGG